LRPRTTDDGELDVIARGERLNIFQALKFEQTRSVPPLRRKVMNENAIAVPLQILRPKKSGRFFDDVRIRLTSEAKDGNCIVRLYVSYDLGQAVLLAGISWLACFATARRFVRSM
jgi:hypothetical protein